MAINSVSGPLINDTTLTALAAFNTNGILTQIAADSFVGRTLIAGSNKVSITDGNGVLGNPTVDVSPANIFAGLNTSSLSEGTNLYFTDERAQDAVGTILTDSSTIDFTYNDTANTIIATAITQLSITSDASGLKLSEDQESPGNTKLYGTDGSGVKGWYAQPSSGGGLTYTQTRSVASWGG